MAEDERIYTIPLRTAKTVPRTQRAERAVTFIRKFASRHMKADADKIWIDNPVNEVVWARSMQKPPPRIRVKMIKFEDGVVEVSLPEEGAETAGSKRKKPEDAAAEADSAGETKTRPAAKGKSTKGKKAAAAEKTDQPKALA
ncbi:MAG: 50S ribosomal protein L31e [Euryarchaeota archaeon]|nr:50S ribosomal protein L31e [Euryarchaeota archaeon]